jgi:hypothetical protein
MAVTITDNMAIEQVADAVTGWTTSATDSTYSGFQREGTNCLGIGGNNSDEDAYVAPGVTSNFNGRTVFGWMINGAPGSPNAIGFGILLGDGTNDRVYSVGGNTNYGSFVQGWSGFRLNVSNLPTVHRNITGSGSPNTANITRIGYGMNYAISAFGKIDNLFYDIIRSIGNGSPALTIGGGSPLDPGTWAEVTADDASTAANKAYGVMRILTSGSKAYELTFGIEIGDSGTGSSNFQDNNFQIVIVGTNMSAGAMDVTALANGTGTNVLVLEDGVLAGVDTVSNWDLSNSNLNTLQFNRMTCSDLGTITFPSSGGTLREVKDCTFNNCGQVTIGNNLTFSGCLFNGTTDANGALLFDSDTDDTNTENLTFISDGSGHALYITKGGTYVLDGYTFTGYGADGTTDAAVYNDSGSPVTLNIVNGSSPTVRNGTGATTTVTQSATLTVAGAWADSEIRIYETGTTTEVAGIENSGSPILASYASDGTFNAGDTQFNSSSYSFVSTDIGNQIEITTGLLAGNFYKITAVGSPGSPYATVTPAFTGSPGSPAITWSRIDPTFDYTYNAATAPNVDIVVHNLAYEYFRITNYDLPSSNSTLLVEQDTDRYYSNP